MITIRPSEERGRTRFEWLDSRHSFSFGDYFDPAHMGFRSLRVINEDWVKPGQGFGTHPHRDMEIVTIVFEGALEHKDSLGTGAVIRPGEVQIMSAGTGIRHSEFNHSRSEPVHLLQVWILPEKPGLKPRYDQTKFPEAERQGRLRLAASRSGRDGSLTIFQDADIYVGSLPAGAEVSHALRPGRHVWVQVAGGGLTLAGKTLETGDGAAVSDERAFEIKARSASEIVLFDLP